MEDIRPHSLAFAQDKPLFVGKATLRHLANGSDTIGAKCQPRGKADQFIHKTRRQQRSGNLAAAFTINAV